MTPQMKPTERKYAHVLRPLTQDERKALRSTLQAYGLIHELVQDQHGDLLDGHHREELCAELGIPVRYKTVTVTDPVHWIKSNQKARRNLNWEEMRALIAEQIIATPEVSDNSLSKTIGVSNSTVSKVRANLLAKGKINNVVRMDSRGYRASPGRPSASQVTKSPTLQVTKSTLQVTKSDTPELPTVVLSDDDKKSKYGEPPVLELSNGKLRKFSEVVLYHFADTGEFHSIPKMSQRLDPDNKLGLTNMHFQRLAHEIKERRKDIYLETRPGPGASKLYRYYRQDRTIGLSVLKAKFSPVIESLKIEGNRPISHQSTGRFLDAAAMLIQILRDLEAE